MPIEGRYLGGGLPNTGAVSPALERARDDLAGRFVIAHHDTVGDGRRHRRCNRDPLLPSDWGAPSLARRLRHSGISRHMRKANRTLPGLTLAPRARFERSDLQVRRLRVVTRPSTAWTVCRSRRKKRTVQSSGSGCFSAWTALRVVSTTSCSRSLASSASGSNGSVRVPSVRSLHA